jgi:uncharacterized protein (DUF1499 family)
MTISALENALDTPGSKVRCVALTLVLLLSACASQVQKQDTTSLADTTRQGLACTLPSNCVDSLSGGPAPLRYTGTPAQALAVLQATLSTFPEARVVRSEPLLIEAIFTTRIGFRDQVEFRIDAQTSRIDFRSRSTFGLFDFFKNRTRMQEFAARFEQQQGH